jgi:thymidylate kinase
MTARLLFYISSVVIASHQIEEELKTRPVVCDRYINSTICYHEAMGVDTSLIEIDKLEIVKPDICICLTVNEKVRVQRIQNRQISSTAPYQEVSADFLLRVSIDLVKHSTHVVDASRLTPEETKSKILQIISKTPVECS